MKIRLRDARKEGLKRRDTAVLRLAAKDPVDAALTRPSALSVLSALVALLSLMNSTRPRLPISVNPVRRDQGRV